ncbi:hypothetical protein SVAN01_04758 [Stagonosporopsis vannaccii]|nr:hypothetical protein SVAN01_04758 [Stagonosporopsis vannaccii]
MLRIRQKRRVTFATLEAQASSSKSASQFATMPVAAAPTTRSNKQKPRHSRKASASKRVSQPPPNAPFQVSDRQRRLASLFMALMASSPLPIETDAETIEAAQKASIAPKAAADTKHKRQVSTVRVQEVRAGRWRRFRYEMSLKTRKGKARRRDEAEMDDLIELRGETRSKGSDMI